MNPPIAILQNVSKVYRLGAERSNWRALIPGRRGEMATGERFYSVRDVSLDIEAGSSLGIIGKNGAGKSTLLKILSGIVQPSSGTVDVFGSVAAVIELGVGFDPELSGRENIRFGATLMGISSNDASRRLDDIIEFSGIERFIDAPLKRYSTGMRARLGFSLVTAFETDIIVLDEVLSVGDWAFQKRSLDRIRELSANGATLVAVSHSNWMLSQICDELVLLEDGSIAAHGDPIDVIEKYTGEGTPESEDATPADQIAVERIHTPDGASPISIADFTLHADKIQPGERLSFTFQLNVERAVPGRIVMSIYSMHRAAFAEPNEGPSHLLSQPGSHEVSGSILSVPLAPGSFHIRVSATDELGEDLNQEYLNAFAVETLPFRIEGQVTSRPGLQFDTRWSVGP